MTTEFVEAIVHQSPGLATAVVITFGFLKYMSKHNGRTENWMREYSRRTDELIREDKEVIRENTRSLRENISALASLKENIHRCHEVSQRKSS